MKLTDFQLAEAAEQAKTNPIMKALLEHHNFVTGSQVYESFVARKIILDKWNEDLIANPISILTPKMSTGKNDKEDMDALTKTDKETDRILKFLEKQPMLLAGSQELFEKLLPSQQEDVKKDKRLSETPDLIF